MKNFSKIIKYTIGILIIISLVIGSLIFYLFENSKNNTLEISSLAKKVGKTAFAASFNYPQNIDEKFSLILKNEKSEEANNLKMATDKNIGASGFVILDLKPQHSNRSIKKLDEVLSDYLNFIEEESSDENEIFDPKLYGYQKENNIILSNLEKITPQNSESFLLENENSPFSKPLSSLLEELWNGQILLLGGAIQLNLSAKNTFLLALSPYLNKTNLLQEILINKTNKEVENYLKKYSIDISVETLNTNTDQSIKESHISLSVTDPQQLLNTICSIKINPWDYCGRLSIKRDTFRKNFSELIEFINTDFKLKLKVFWALKGKTLVYSNNLSFIEKLLTPQKNSDEDNTLKSTTSIGKDYLLENHTAKNILSVSFLFDMIRIQNELIDFSERIRQNSNILSDYFSSPSGEAYFSSFENKINKITGYSEKAVIKFESDGVKLVPELKLYSPTGDLFQNDGKELRPEVLNSIETFILKTLLFRNNISSKETFPLPNPNIQRQGKWVIINTEIMLNKILPFLQLKKPYFDQNYEPTNL
ncbi:hypothetical protein [Fluviispira vulneris]|uniref:hypothetical protein n=1 Tax=Fluviispira vulneris TaxID=2763012 RepID=UPI001646B490|nr:hypothetical protein [Fluviispira vulneris]